MLRICPATGLPRVTAWDGNTRNQQLPAADGERPPSVNRWIYCFSYGSRARDIGTGIPTEERSRTKISVRILPRGEPLPSPKRIVFETTDFAFFSHDT